MGTGLPGPAASPSPRPVATTWALRPPPLCSACKPHSALPFQIRAVTRPGSEEVALGTEGTTTPDMGAGRRAGAGCPLWPPASVESSVSLCLLVPQSCP